MRLRVHQSLWGMGGLPYRGGEEWSLDEKLGRIAEAGFDGVNVAWTSSLPAGAEAIERAPEFGLEWSAIVFPGTVEDFKPLAEMFAGLGARAVNIQANVRPLTVLEGIPYVLGWMEIAREAGLDVHFETHRDRMTTSLRYTLQLIDAIPAMRLVGDLSHFVVGEEFSWPISDEDQALMHRIVERSDGFHGRVASREQVQIALDFPQNRQWVDLFAGWWEEGMRLWRERSGPDDELVFVTELGPPWYAIRGADGQELSDRWQEAQALKELVREIWNRLEGGRSAEPS